LEETICKLRICISIKKTHQNSGGQKLQSRGNIVYTEYAHLKTAFWEPAIAFEEAMLVER
jgi:hypothetical protein